MALPDGRAVRIPAAEPQKKELIMSTLMNRMLDVVASYAIVALSLTVAGATAVIGA